MATKQSSWQKTNLSQPKVKIVVITTLVATKPCRCDKKAWYKDQKLVVWAPEGAPTPRSRRSEGGASGAWEESRGGAGKGPVPGSVKEAGVTR